MVFVVPVLAGASLLSSQQFSLAAQLKVSRVASYSFRSEDYRKQWQRKANVQLVAVVAGATLGGIPSLIDRYTPTAYPYWVVDGAVLFSNGAGLVSFFFF